MFKLFYSIFLAVSNIPCFLKEWSEDTYPPWAHGPGYVVTNDIATTIYRKHKKGRLKVLMIKMILQLTLTPLFSLLFWERIKIQICILYKKYLCSPDVQARRCCNGNLDCRYEEERIRSYICKGRKDLQRGVQWWLCDCPLPSSKRAALSVAEASRRKSCHMLQWLTFYGSFFSWESAFNQHQIEVSRLRCKIEEKVTAEVKKKVHWGEI